MAWGFRNPFGLAFSSDGCLYCTDNMYDERGCRPVYDGGDLMWKVQPGLWYGYYHDMNDLLAYIRAARLSGPPFRLVSVATPT